MNRTWMVFVLLLLFMETVFAADMKVSAPRTVEIGAQSWQLQSDKPLPEGVWELKAQVKLPLVERQYVVEQQQIELFRGGIAGGVSSSVPQIASKTNAFSQHQLLKAVGSIPNLLDADEFWLTYKSNPESRQCKISVDIEAIGTAEGLPKNNGMSSAIPLKLFLSSQQTRRIDVPLGAVNAIPRDASYLLKRARGMSEDSGWRYVDEGKVRIFMRLLHVDLRDIDSIDLELDEAVERVNFRLSRSDTGKPTDLLDWDGIPKDMYVRNGKRWLRLGLGSAVRQQISGGQGASGPLVLVELLAFVQKASLTSDLSPPVLQLTANYTEQTFRRPDGAIQFLAKNERIAPGEWRMRVNLATLKETKMREIRFVRGQIFPEKTECIAAYEWAGFVSKRARMIPAELANAQDLASTWGGAFGLAHEGRDEVEMPKFLVHVSPGAFSEGAFETVLRQGNRKAWNSMGLAVTSRSVSGLIVSLDSSGLRVEGDGDAEVSWAFALSLPTNAYLFMRSGIAKGDLHEATVRLRFQDGRTVNLPYTFNEALSLHSFAGRKLIGADLILHLSNKGGFMSVADMAIFTVRVLAAEQALKETLMTGNVLDSYRVKLGDTVFTPKPPAEVFWRDLAKGPALLDYGHVHWLGGGGIPVLNSAHQVFGPVKEWKFVSSKQRHEYMQTGLADPTSSTWIEPSRWMSLALFALLAVWIGTLWQRRLLQQSVVSLWSNLVQMLNRIPMAMQATAAQLLYSLAAKRQVINLLSAAVLGGAALYFSGCGLAGILQCHQLLCAWLVLALFTELNIWRWRLQEGVSRPGDFLRCWIIGSSLLPPRIFWVVAGGIFLLIALETVNQVATAEGVSIGRFFPEMGLVDGIALIAIAILVDPQKLVAWVPLLLSVLYGLIPWFARWGCWLMTAKACLARWFIIAFAIYAAGLSRIARPGENYFFTFGDLAMVGVLHAWMWSMKDFIEIRWPAIAVNLYKGSGSVYFGCAALGLIVTGVLALLRLEFLADHVAVIVYFCLVVGSVLEMVSSRFRRRVRSDCNLQK